MLRSEASSSPPKGIWPSHWNCSPSAEVSVGVINHMLLGWAWRVWRGGLAGGQLHAFRRLQTAPGHSNAPGRACSNGLLRLLPRPAPLNSPRSLRLADGKYHRLDRFGHKLATVVVPLTLEVEEQHQQPGHPQAVDQAAALAAALPASSASTGADTLGAAATAAAAAAAKAAGISDSGDVDGAGVPVPAAPPELAGAGGSEMDYMNNRVGGGWGGRAGGRVTGRVIGHWQGAGRSERAVPIAPVPPLPFPPPSPCLPADPPVAQHAGVGAGVGQQHCCRVGS